MNPLSPSEAQPQWLARAFERSPVSICVTDADADILFVNPRFCAITGYAAVEAVGRNIRMLKSGRMPQSVYAGLWQALRSEGEWHGELLNRRKDGAYYWERLSISVLRDEDGQVRNYISIMEDISAERERIAGIRLRDQALAASYNGVMIIDVGEDPRRIVYVNAAFERITGYSASEAVAIDPQVLFGDDEADVEAFLSALAVGRESEFVLPARRRNGDSCWLTVSLAPVRDESGRVSHYVSVLDDVTQQKRYERQLEYQASHDALTGLVNRVVAADRLAQAIVAARRDGAMAAVLLIDLDRFKSVNDGLGHAAGDRLLVEVARRLASTVRAGDTVARLGGDEFLMVLPNVGDADAAERVAAKLIEEIGRPLMLDDHEFHPAASIGVALYPRDGDGAEVLVRHADIAMYRAKHAGGEGLRLFEPGMDARLGGGFSVEAGLRRAIEQGELEVHYQPQVDLRTGRIRGAEALLRWRHPERGLLAPAEFLDVAERTGLIVPVGEWVLGEACRAAFAWRQAGLPPVSLAVNISARQFARHPLAETCRRVLASTQFEPSMLEIELTEGMVSADPEQAAQVMRRLRDLGVRLALDDFGTGYSSLLALKRFPIQRLKIDRGFVQDITHDTGSAAIAASVIGMAHGLEMQVVAEGVETEAQLAFLRRQGCDEFQGFVFSEPLPRDAFAELLRGGRALAAVEDAATTVGRTLMLVDDEPGVLNALTRLFRRDGYRILTAQSGDEALEMLAREPVQVIISDQRMPRMSGTEFLARVKGLYPETIRIVLSGYTELSAVTDAINHGAIYQFLTKPWNDGMLRDNVRRAFAAWEQAARRRQGMS